MTGNRRQRATAAKKRQCAGVLAPPALTTAQKRARFVSRGARVDVVLTDPADVRAWEEVRAAGIADGLGLSATVGLCLQVVARMLAQDRIGGRPWVGMERRGVRFDPAEVPVGEGEP
jgi:hypothetical protein